LPEKHPKRIISEKIWTKRDCLPLERRWPMLTIKIHIDEHENHFESTQSADHGNQEIHPKKKVEYKTMLFRFLDLLRNKWISIKTNYQQNIGL
jgi:hypothetical protein